MEGLFQVEEGFYGVEDGLIKKMEGKIVAKYILYHIVEFWVQCFIEFSFFTYKECGFVGEVRPIRWVGFFVKGWFINYGIIEH